MKILALSDFHGNLGFVKKAALRAKEKEVDLIVVSGDLTHFGTLDTAIRILKLLQVKPVFFVPGNCDPLELAGKSFGRAENLHGKIRVFRDLTFVGVGGALTSYFNTPFEMSEEDLHGVVEEAFKVDFKKLVIVSHTPPKNTRLDLAFNRTHVGSETLRRLIEEKKPILALCGHIHEAKGIDTIGETVIVNPGPARDGFCAYIEVGDEVKVKLGTL